MRGVNKEERDCGKYIVPFFGAGELLIDNE